MKLRNGFISNSSSSSFVVVTTKENHEKALEGLTKWQKKVIAALMFPRKLGKINLYIGGEYSDASCSGTLDWVEEELGQDPEAPEDAEVEMGDEEWTVMGAWMKYQELLGKEDKDYVGTSIGDNG